jgi:nucleoside 2-deoxyribosyltransferase
MYNIKGLKNFTKIFLPPIENMCFVIIPFKFNILYSQVIKKAIEELSMECIRADEIYKPNVIIKDIWNSIRKARFIIADITERNPNVLYELGLAHAIGKPVILINRDDNEIPFDIAPIKYIKYDINNPFWGRKLTKEIHQTINEMDKGITIPTFLDDITTKISKHLRNLLKFLILLDIGKEIQ